MDVMLQMDVTLQMNGYTDGGMGRETCQLKYYFRCQMISDKLNSYFFPKLKASVKMLMALFEPQRAERRRS